MDAKEEEDQVDHHFAAATKSPTATGTGIEQGRGVHEQGENHDYEEHTTHEAMLALKAATATRAPRGSPVVRK